MSIVTNSNKSSTVNPFLMELSAQLRWSMNQLDVCLWQTLEMETERSDVDCHELMDLNGFK